MEPHVSYPDDGSMAIEWIANCARFSISIEKDVMKSFWCYICKDGTMAHGLLPMELLDTISYGVRVKEIRSHFKDQIEMCSDEVVVIRDGQAPGKVGLMYESVLHWCEKQIRELQGKNSRLSRLLDKLDDEGDKG